MILALICFVAMGGRASAMALDNTLALPQRITAFANENADAIADMLANDGMVTYAEAENQHFGKPYIIYNSYDNQEGIYYFPIVVHNKIVAVTAVLDTEDGMKIQVEEDLVDQLNEIGYIYSDFILYEYKNDVYAENAAGKNYLYSYASKQTKLTEEQKRREQNFYEATFRKKYKMANARIKQFTKCRKKEDSARDNLNALIMGSLNLYKPMGQYNYNMCWAAAAATVINYKKTSAVTPFEVCNRTGIAYNSGGTIYNEQDALSKYGVTYEKVRNSMLDWSTLTKNIDNSHPIIANLKCNDGTLNAHAVTIYGYTSTSKTIKYWDSRTNSSKETTTFSAAGSNFLAISGHSYSWMTTLSKQ